MEIEMRLKNRLLMNEIKSGSVGLGAKGQNPESVSD